MEKRKYEKPMLISEAFIPNEYVAACEHSESGAGLYKFVCNAGRGRRGDIFLEDGTNLTRNSGWWETSYYIACNKAHQAPTTDEFKKGYFYANEGNDKVEGYTPIPVIIWTGDGDIHATENLNQDTWEKNVS